MLNKLEPGEYNLTFKKTSTLITIKVLEGMHFDKKFILKENSAIITSNDYLSIGIQNIKIKESEVTVNISGHTDDNSVVYALLFNYISPELMNVIEELKKIGEIETAGEILFNKPDNLYMPSKLLDEEYQYVLERKKQSRFVGSTLDKPQLLLKRLFLQDTKTETQVAQKGDEFADIAHDGYAMAMNRLGCTREVVSSSKSCKQKAIPIPLDFLKYNAKWVIVPIQNKTAIFSIKGSYSNLFVIAFNSVGISYQIASLSNTLQKKDLRLKDSVVNSTEIRKIKEIIKGDNLAIEDIGSTSIEILDSFEKIFNALKAITNDDEGDDNPILRWEFLINWPKLSFSAKKDLYDKHLSHEFNLFLYHRDKDFFEKTVKPFLVCKMKKDFIDKYLCGECLDE